MSKTFNMSKTQYLRLQGYLYDLHMSGEVCVFSDLSGHVDWLQVRVTYSRQDYATVLFNETIYIVTDYKPDQTDKEIVDEIIARIDKGVKDKATKLAEIQEKREADEKAQYEKLKAKYENTND